MVFCAGSRTLAVGQRAQNTLQLLKYTGSRDLRRWTAAPQVGFGQIDVQARPFGPARPHLGSLRDLLKTANQKATLSVQTGGDRL